MHYVVRKLVPVVPALRNERPLSPSKQIQRRVPEAVVRKICGEPERQALLEEANESTPVAVAEVGARSYGNRRYIAMEMMNQTRFGPKIMCLTVIQPASQSAAVGCGS